jgi:hypothetical protein
VLLDRRELDDASLGSGPQEIVFNLISTAKDGVRGILGEQEATPGIPMDHTLLQGQLCVLEEQETRVAAIPEDAAHQQ